MFDKFENFLYLNKYTVGTCNYNNTTINTHDPKTGKYYLIFHYYWLIHTSNPFNPFS